MRNVKISFASNLKLEIKKLRRMIVRKLKWKMNCQMKFLRKEKLYSKLGP